VVKKYVCGLDAAVDVIDGKWKPLILWELGQQPRRPGALRRELHGVTEKVLLQQLRELERDGVVVRTAEATSPPTVTYSLSERGIALNTALEALGDWGEQHLDHIVAVRSG
jgi:DNA-binding HxlR family transcriptional regulator